MTLVQIVILLAVLGGASLLFSQFAMKKEGAELVKKPAPQWIRVVRIILGILFVCYILFQIYLINLRNEVNNDVRRVIESGALNQF